MRSQARELLREVGARAVWIYLPIGLFLAGLCLWAVYAESDFSFYWRDPAAIVNTGPWIGLFSNVGIFIWWAAAVVCVFTALVLWHAPGHRRYATFLLVFGLFTGMLALDDFFMIHEWVIPTYLPLSDDVTFGVYVLVGALLLGVFRNEVLGTPYPILALAIGCLAASIAIDVFVFDVLQQRGIYQRLVWNLEYIVEDGLKLVGIIAWVHYFGLACYMLLRRNIGLVGDAEALE